METKPHLLVIDDEEDLCDILKFNLECDGYRVDTVHSAEEALKMDLHDYDLLLIDIMMGEMSGLKMTQIIQSHDQYRDIPFIFITARDSENDTITGFNMGADDYISKPFSVREVSLRVKAVLRRTAKVVQSVEATQSALPVAESFVFKQLQLDEQNKTVMLKRESLALTRKEFEILHLLLSNQNHIFSRGAIMDCVWGNEVVVSDRTVDVNITRLRKKLGDYGKYIVNRTGYGYRWNAEE